VVIDFDILVKIQTIGTKIFVNYQNVTLLAHAQSIFLNDQKFFELIIPIATFLTGTLSGIMLAGGDKDAQKQALAAANKGWDKSSTPSGPTLLGGGFGAAPGTSFTPAPSWGTTPIMGSSGGYQSGYGATPPMGNSFGAAGGFASATMMPTMAKPMPSRPPFEENFPEIN